MPTFGATERAHLQSAQIKDNLLRLADDIEGQSDYVGSSVCRVAAIHDACGIKLEAKEMKDHLNAIQANGISGCPHKARLIGQSSLSLGSYLSELRTDLKALDSSPQASDEQWFSPLAFLVEPQLTTSRANLMLIPTDRLHTRLMEVTRAVLRQYMSQAIDSLHDGPYSRHTPEYRAYDADLLRNPASSLANFSITPSPFVHNDAGATTGLGHIWNGFGIIAPVYRRDTGESGIDRELLRQMAVRSFNFARSLAIGHELISLRLLEDLADESHGTNPEKHTLASTNNGLHSVEVKGQVFADMLRDEDFFTAILTRNTPRYGCSIFHGAEGGVVGQIESLVFAIADRLFFERVAK